MGLNDPQWGNKGGGNGGPPDLEELARKLNAKIAAMMGGKGDRTESRPSSGGAPGFGVSIGLIAAIVGLIWLGSGFYIVNEGERGVVLRFGKYVETTQSGPRWHVPFPVEAVEMVNLSQMRTIEVGYRENPKNKQMNESLMVTDDENIIDIQFAVQYLVKDPVAFLFNNKNAESSVRLAAEAAIREIVGRSKMDAVLSKGREDVAKDTATLIQMILDQYQAGIQVSMVNMQNAQPPEQVQAAFHDAVSADQDRERQINEGQAYANDVVPRAAGMAARLMQEAQGYKQSVIANAEGDASRFKQVLVEYEKAPVVTRERMFLDMQQQVLSNVSKVLVDQKNGSSLLYLPLDKLVETARKGADGEAAAVAAPTPAPAADAGAAQRGALSREREAR